MEFRKVIEVARNRIGTRTMDAYAVGFVVGLCSRLNFRNSFKLHKNRALKTLGCEGPQAVWRAYKN